MTNILLFKKPSHIGAITVTFKYDALEDGTVWYCWKLFKEWSEWGMIDE